MASRIVPSFRPPGLPAARLAPPQAFPYEAPAHLYAGVTVQSGAEASFRARALSNLTRQPIEIHEIRVNTEISAAGRTTAKVNPGMFTEIKLDLDGKPITNGFVPAWLLGRIDNVFTETVDSTPGGTLRNVLATATWRLPHPMRMKPGAVVNAQVRHRGLVADPIAVDLGLAGRYVASPKAGLLTRVPYITAFLGTPTAFDAAGAEAIPETALWNALQRPLHVERLHGRAAFFASASSLLYAFDDLSGDFLAKLLRVRLALSTGQAILTRPAPFGAVFSPASGMTLELPFVMNPGEYVTGAIEKDARGGIVSANYGGTYSIQPQIALSGWREE